jgi:16S rRNA (cytosine967-C5)-methyltransferase
LAARYQDRSAALAILDLVRKDRILAVAATRHVAVFGSLKPADRALANHLALGVLRSRLLLDHLLAVFAARKAPSDPRLRDILHLGLFQLLLMDRIPAHAALDSTVTLARNAKGAGTAGFVNAILRRASLEGPALLAGDLAPELRHSLPWWMASRLKTLAGPAYLAELAALDSPSPVAMRFRCPREQLEAECLRWGLVPSFDDRFPESVFFGSDSNPYETVLFTSGLLLPQDPASCAVVDLLAPQEGHRVLDLAAGLGVKTLHISDRCRGQDSSLTAVDLNPRRLEKLKARRDLEAVVVLQADIGAPLPLAPASFDRILLDAPCSGIGTIRRHPEIKWWRTEADLLSNTQLQRRMLANALSLLAPGGRLVYSVCSYSPEEGPEVVEAVLPDHPGVQLVPVPPRLSAQGGPYLQTLASQHNADLFFAAILEKPQGRS